MATGKSKHHASVTFWMFALFIMAVPVIGQIMTLVWAWVGEDRTRKNFFRAVIAWYLVLFALSVTLFLLGLWPEIWRQMKIWWERR